MEPDPRPPLQTHSIKKNRREMGRQPRHEGLGCPLVDVESPQRESTRHNHEILGSKRMEKEISPKLKKGCALLQPTEKYLFSITMTEVREWSAIRKKKWLHTVQAARYSSSIRHQSTQQSRTFMFDWLRSG